MKEFCRRQRGRWERMTGVALVILGSFWLAHKMGWIPAHGAGATPFWPLLTIVAGVLLLCLARPGKREEKP